MTPAEQMEYARALRPVLATIAFVFGTIWGSFFNVCIYRIPARKSIVHPGSHCYSCGSFLAWYDNIPVISYLWLGGNCRSCGSHFSPRYALVEFLSGLMFMTIFLVHGPEWVVIAHCLFASFLVVGTFTDIDHYIIPDSVTVGGLVFSLIVAAVFGGNSLIGRDFAVSREIYHSFWPTRTAAFTGDVGHIGALIWSLAGAGFGWALLAGIGVFGRVIFRKEAMGGGDVKLFAFLGAYFGPINCLYVLGISTVLGAAFGVTIILVHKLLRQDEFEEIELAPDKAVQLHSRILAAQSAWRHQRDTVMAGMAIKTGSAVLEESGANLPAITADSRDPAPLSLKIARSTSRQLHHFPFGPYIAAAALIVLLCYPVFEQTTRHFFMLDW
ncbi:MAG: prepilin peptidase [Candidatus Sumerlaeaceae bacterium]|nr:prepilin peptidase [Candidatus Sumerlaeaceae bacterium]